jgi:hypothetical protein
LGAAYEGLADHHQTTASGQHALRRGSAGEPLRPADTRLRRLDDARINDLRLLAAVLRRFAREHADVRLDQLVFCAAPRTTVTVTASSGVPGIQPVGGNDFVWRLNGHLADAFADQIDQLAAPAREAGSEILACTTEEEILVKVSRGEYTDDFLTLA